MRRFQIKTWMVLAALLLVLAISFFSTFFLKNREGTAVEHAAGAVAAPAVGTVHRATSSVKDFFLRLFALRDVDKEYEQLKTKVAALQMENWMMVDLQKEVENLNKLANFTSANSQFSYLPARAIGKEPGSWFLDITLDRGSADGVEKDMNVITQDGLVGRIVEVGPNWCKVMTLLDRQSSVSIMIERNRGLGLVKGPGDPGVSDPKCNVEYLNSDVEVVPGDQVITSDFGGIFQKGIPVGKITEVSRDANNPYALLTPAVNFATIENVLIIKGGRKIPTAEDIAKDRESAAKASASASPAAGSNSAAGTQPSPTPSPTPSAGTSPDATSQP